jgi:hypothetical protein
MALSDKDVDETMAADWAKIQEKYTPEPDDAPERDTPAAATGDVEIDPKPETIPVSRRPDGKFKAQEDAQVDKGNVKVDKAARGTPDKVAAPAKDKAAPAAADIDASAPAATGDQPQGRDINRAPSTWKPAARALWDKVDPALRAEIHRREADFQNGQAQLLPDATLGKNMREVIRPYEMMIQAEGGTPERAVADLMRTAAVFRTGTVPQKYQAIAQIANQFGIDLRRFAPQPAAGAQPQPNAQQQPTEFRDPRVDQLLAQQNEERRLSAQREQQQTESTVTRWMNEVDASGNPKRQYLGDVINEMSALVPQIRAHDPTLTHAQALDAAYDRAIWAHPEIRTLLAQKQQADLDAQRRTDNQARVRDARRAGSVNVPRRGSTPAPGKPGKMEDTIAETARALGMIS